jgi:hypothetical protein
MSMWTSLRDSVITPTLAAQVTDYTGIQIPTSTSGAAAPSGATGVGGVPNKNPSIFSSLTSSTGLLIVSGLLLLLLFKMRH